MRFLTVRCSALLGLVACSGSTEPAGATAVLIPLTAGAQWTYSASDTLIGSVGNERPEPDSSLTVRVLGSSASAGGTPWVDVDSLFRLLDTEPDPGHGLYANEPGGFYHLLSGVLPSRVLGFPATLGLFTNFGTMVVATDTAITVPAGTFHCIRYDRDEGFGPPQDPVAAVFIAPGFGVVKRVETREYFLTGNNSVVTGRVNRVFVLTGSNVPLVR